MTKLHLQKVSIIRIVSVRIKNFRCLRLVELHLNDLTILIGENNAGKSSFLEALHAAIGSGMRSLNSEDLYVGEGESSVPKDREVIIDLLLRPTGEDNNPIETFPEGSPWLELFGNAVQQDDQENDFVGIRSRRRLGCFWGTFNPSRLHKRSNLL